MHGLKRRSRLYPRATRTWKFSAKAECDVGSGFYAHLHKKGIQYIFEYNPDNPVIRVRLTEEGMKKYRKILHNRPSYETVTQDQDGYIYMDFYQSTGQILYYFMQFGKEAVIMSPGWLKDKMLNMYSEAAEAYQN